MKIRSIAVAVATFGFACLPGVATAESISIQSLAPSANVVAKSLVSFSIVPSGFSSPTYTLTDSFSPTTLSLSNIDPGGKLSWIPVVQDVGTHTISITARDNAGALATVTQTITVLAPPSVSVDSISPTGAIIPGTRLTFRIIPNGFTNPTYIVGDQFGGSSVASSNLDSAGNFAWTPDVAQNGEHVITVYASDSSGRSASVNVPIRVGVGPTLRVASVTPSANVTTGQTVTFAVSALNYNPTAFSVSDSLSGTTISNSNINTSGLFSWAPQQSDIGVHMLTVTGRVGAYGDVATTSVTISVTGTGGMPPVAIPATAATSSSLLSTLQAQLAALQAKMTSQSQGNSTVFAPAFTSYLKPGSNGAEVLQLQNLLKDLEFFPGTPNGNYGPMTVESVTKFQAAHDLDKLGVVGPATRAKLNALLSESAGGVSTLATIPQPTTGTYVFQHFMGVGDDDEDEVSELQKRLVSLGHLKASPTGYYGPATESAVKKFQKSKGLPQTGYVNKATRAALNQ